MPSGEPVQPDKGFPPAASRTRVFWKFKYLNITRAKELVEERKLILRRRIEIKAELRKTFRNDGKVSSRTWHLASILERDISNPIKCQSFWNKIEDKLKTFELSETEQAMIREKIEAVVPRPSKT